MRRILKGLIAAGIILLLFSVSACGKKEENERKEIDFTVCDDTKIPKELLEIINEKKSQVFKLSYVNSDYLYIVIGYGEHSRKNLNVVVEDLYVTNTAVYIETNLMTNVMTPSDYVAAGYSSMYPYIVLKCENYDLPVIFEID